MWPGVCQSWVSTTCSKAVARRLMSGMTWSPSFTASEPPGVKQFCTSMTRRASCAVGFIFRLPVCAAAARAVPATPAAPRLAAVPLRNPRRSNVTMPWPPLPWGSVVEFCASIGGVWAREEALDERAHLVAVPFARAHRHAGHLAARTDEEGRRKGRDLPAVGGL